MKICCLCQELQEARKAYYLKCKLIPFDMQGKIELEV